MAEEDAEGEPMQVDSSAATSRALPVIARDKSGRRKGSSRRRGKQVKNEPDVDVDGDEEIEELEEVEEGEEEIDGEEDAEDDASESDISEIHNDAEDVDEDETGEQASLPDGDALSEEELEGEEEDEEVEEEEDDGEENEDEEGVGAVKIRPGETEDEDDESASGRDDDEEDDEEDDDDAASGSEVSDNDFGAEWERAKKHNSNGDDESEANDASLCIFCKKDEEHDPAEDFETFLACKGCGEHAHQLCAREAQTLEAINVPSSWTCPECPGIDDQHPESETEAAADDGDAAGPSMQTEDNDLLSPASLRSTAQKLARDLLPSQRGINKPDSHSVFNQLVLDDDPMDGSRVLRKRKTSSAEAEIEEETLALRKRPKNEPEDLSADVNAPASGKVVDSEDDELRPRSRSMRLKIPNPSASASCSVLKKSRNTLVMQLRVPAPNLQRILSQEPNPDPSSSSNASSMPVRNRAPMKKRSRRTIIGARSRRSRNATSRAKKEPLAPEPIVSAPFSSTTYTQPFYSFYDKETDELKGKPYGGILTEAEADTSKTLPTKDDRRRFDEAKQKADEEWRNRLLAMQAELEVPVKKNKKANDPASQIECIQFGGWEIDTWYAAPYPEEYSRNRVLYICEFCLKYMNSDYVAWRHKLKCPAKHPPGDEIYRQDSISFFEVDGRKNPVYCQNLCLLAKLFLGSKTLYYDVEPFLFYVLCEYDDLGYHFVGYFSKEKRASSQNNVSCILTLPIHQRKGYGNLLIDFSYLLTRVEGKTGSPEKPLSDMGLVSYRNYWRLVLCKYLILHTPSDKSQRKGLSIHKISDDTGMMPDDVISALEGLRCLVRDPVTHVYAFRVDLPYCHEYVAKWEAKRYVQLNESVLTWTPYVMGRSSASNFELGPSLNAIAPREDEEDKAVHVLAKGVDAVSSFATSNGDIHSTSETTVLQSTEPDDDAMVTDHPTQEDQPPLVVNGIKKDEDHNENYNTNSNYTDDLASHPDPNQENIAPPPTSVPAPASPQQQQSQSQSQSQSQPRTQEPPAPTDWSTPYDKIPPIRFEVFPPVNPRRTAASYALAAAAAPSSRISSMAPRSAPARRTVSAPKPRQRSGGGGGGRSARRSTASSSRNKSGGGSSSNNTRRRTGGTGRGPGRWPKGTKKSDYGNADSGPGLPPAWLEKKKQGGGTGEGDGNMEGVGLQALGESGGGEVEVEVELRGKGVGKGKGKGKGKQVETLVVFAGMQGGEREGAGGENEGGEEAGDGGVGEAQEDRDADGGEQKIMEASNAGDGDGDVTMGEADAEGEEDE